MASGRRLGRAAGPGASPPPGRFTDRPLCRLQVHLPLSLSRARLPGLQRAPGPGLGTGAGAGYERGECGPGARAKLGSTCGRAPRKASAGERPKGWLPCGDPLTARRVAGAVLPTARARPAPRRAALRCSISAPPLLPAWRPRWYTCARAWCASDEGRASWAELSGVA